MLLKFQRILFTNSLCYFKWINIYIKQATRVSNVIFEIFFIGIRISEPTNYIKIYIFKYCSFRDSTNVF